MLDKVAAVTGPRGLVGRYLVRRLVDAGWQVRVLSRGEASTMPDSVPDSVFVARGDLLGDPAQLEDFCRGSDAVFHCAGEILERRTMIEANVVATQNICSAAAACSCHLVHVSSAGVYGRPKTAVVTESSPIAPMNLYELTKASSEEVVRRWTARGLSSSIAQPTTVMAVDMPNDSIRALSRAIHRGVYLHFAHPGAVANYILAADVARGLEALADCRSSGTYILNDPLPAERFIEAIRIGVGRTRRPSPRMPLALGLGLGLIGESIPYVPLTRSRVRALGTRVTYDSGRFTQATGLLPSGELLGELAAIAAKAVGKG